MKSRLELLAEQAEEGGTAVTAVYPRPPIIVYTGSQRPRFPRRRQNTESAVFGSTADLKHEVTRCDGGNLKKVVAVSGRRIKSSSPGNIINSLSVLPPRPPSTTTRYDDELK